MCELSHESQWTAHMCEVRHVLKCFARTCTGATGALGELEPISLGQEALDFINKNLIWYSV